MAAGFGVVFQDTDGTYPMWLAGVNRFNCVITDLWSGARTAQSESASLRNALIRSTEMSSLSA